MKKYPTSLAIGEMQIKTVLRLGIQFTFIITALRVLKQEDLKFKASLGYK
jgi:hypothetical protein